jgi:hypothetical protein
LKFWGLNYKRLVVLGAILYFPFFIFIFFFYNKKNPKLKNNNYNKIKIKKRKKDSSWVVEPPRGIPNGIKRFKVFKHTKPVDSNQNPVSSSKNKID